MKKHIAKVLAIGSWCIGMLVGMPAVLLAYAIDSKAANEALDRIDLLLKR